MAYDNVNLGAEAGKSFKELSFEAKQLLRERHDRIKKEQRNNLSTMIGLSGGAIILSVTLLEKIAPRRMHVGLLATAWIALGAAVLTGVISLVLMTARSIRHQNDLEDLFNRGSIYIFNFPASTPGGKGLILTKSIPGETGMYVTQGLFAVGTIVLAVFVVWNLLGR